jgi:hypothetical protein
LTGGLTASVTEERLGAFFKERHLVFAVWKGIALAIVASLSILASADTVQVTVDGNPISFPDAQPQMVNGRVLVPLRGVFEAMGATVLWDAPTQSIAANNGSRHVRLRIGEVEANVDGKVVEMDTPPEIFQGSTLVPLRFLGQALGASVDWEPQQNLVVLKTQRGQGGSIQAPPEQDVDQGSGTVGPVRMARISWIQGGVTWRPGDDVDWSDAAVNLPLREGAEIWVNPGARAEIQFDDGSFLRLGNGAIATLQTMFSDDQGEFTEIRLNTGTATLWLTNGMSTYQLDTPLASVKAGGPANLRIDDTNGLRLAVRSGQAQAQGDGQQLTLQSGDYLNLRDGNSPFAVGAAPGEDSWDQFWDRRIGFLAHPSPYLPSSIALVACDLDSYGTWSNDPQYGYCWHPRVADANWGPYQTGHWVWVSPFGWTWCATEPWGWAPYHYGTWCRSGGSWAWCPGPAQQYWSPAVVHFSSYNGSIGWCALAPAEVRYPPAISIGMRAGNWSLNFSIGGAACYYPSGGSYCEPRPWTNAVVNQTTNVYNVTRVTNIRTVYVSNNGFVPRNSRLVGGAAIVAQSEFGHGGGAYHAAPPNDQIFIKGQMFAPPSRGAVRFAGPTNVRPSADSFTPSHAFTAARPNPALFSRQVVRAALPGRAAAQAKPMPNSRALSRATPNVGTPRTRTNPGTPGRRNPAQSRSTGSLAPRPGTRPGNLNRRSRPTPPAPAGTKALSSTKPPRPNLSTRQPPKTKPIIVKSPRNIQKPAPGKTAQPKSKPKSKPKRDKNSPGG